MKKACLALLALLVLLGGCVALPDNIEPVTGFQADRYLGRWYEIARLDHSFERGLSRVTAQYARRDDGGIEVVNRGWSDSEKAWQESRGKAYFVEGPDVGHLKVSFFGPFYGAYGIFVLDADYRFAMVSGPDKSYLWLLSRTPTLDARTRDRLVANAAALGFPTDKLIFVDQRPLP
jgi:apolipoprotein D and lipocalin family protein